MSAGATKVHSKAKEDIGQADGGLLVSELTELESRERPTAGKTGTQRERDKEWGAV